MVHTSRQVVQSSCWPAAAGADSVSLNHTAISDHTCAVVLTVCRYVVVEADGVTAASWQRGANNVLALQMNDEEVEVYDNW